MSHKRYTGVDRGTGKPKDRYGLIGDSFECVMFECSRSFRCPIDIQHGEEMRSTRRKEIFFLNSFFILKIDEFCHTRTKI